jgi:hypothetical protein
MLYERVEDTLRGVAVPEWRRGESFFSGAI